jgi:hypothetical protein
VTTTVSLAFHDPTTYAVDDRYIVTALFSDDRALQLSDYPQLLTALRNQNPGEFVLRTVETASYQQYRAIDDVGRQ